MFVLFCPICSGQKGLDNIGSDFVLIYRQLFGTGRDTCVKSLKMARIAGVSALIND